MPSKKPCHHPFFLVVVLLFSSLAQAMPQKAADLLEDAKGYFAENNYRAAVIQLKNTLAEEPNSIEARLLLADAYLTMGDGSSAEKEYERAAKLGAAPRYWQTGLAKAYLLQNKFGKLLEQVTVDKTTTAEQQSAVHILRGYAQIGNRDYELAAASFATALKIKPTSAEAILGQSRLAQAQGNTKQAFDLANQAITLSPTLSDALQMRAELNMRQGELKQAVSDYTRSIELDPRNVRALVGRAEALIKLGLDERARSDLQSYETAQPGSPAAAYLRAILSFRSNQLDTAISHLETTLRTVPDHYHSQLLYGVIRYIQGQQEASIEYLAKAYKQNPGHPQLAKLLTAAYLRLKNPDEAVAVLSPHAQASTDAQLLSLLGAAYMMQGENDLASQTYNRALVVAPDIAALKAELAINLLQAGDDTALGELKSSVNLADNLSPLDPLLVLAHINQQDYDAALQAAESFMEKQPENPVAHNLVGIVLLAKQQNDNAKQHFNQALELNPQFYEARINLARINLIEENPLAAKEQYHAVLAEKPEHFSALLGMIALAVQEKVTPEVETWVKRTLNHHPQTIQPELLLANHYLATNQAAKAAGIADELKTRFPDNGVVLFTLARAQLATGFVNRAVNNLQSLVDLQPDNVTARLLLAETYLAVNKQVPAREQFETILELQPNQVNAHVGLSSIEMAAGNHKKALKIANEIVQLAPELAEGYRLKGLVHLKLGDYPSASIALKKAYEKEPTGKIAGVLADVYKATGDMLQATEILKDWLQHAPKDTKHRRQLAFLLHGAGEVTAAQQEYEILVSADNSDSVVLNNLALIYFENSDPRASSTAQRAYQLTPNRSSIKDTYGWILLNTGEQNKGLKILQDALVLAPDDEEIRLHVATGLIDTGKTDEAIIHLEQLLNGAFSEKAKKLLDSLQQ